MVEEILHAGCVDSVMDGSSHVVFSLWRGAAGDLDVSCADLGPVSLGAPWGECRQLTSSVNGERQFGHSSGLPGGVGDVLWHSWQ
jgi:hypothetical protein